MATPPRGFIQPTTTTEVASTDIFTTGTSGNIQSDFVTDLTSRDLLFDINENLKKIVFANKMIVEEDEL